MASTNFNYSPTTGNGNTNVSVSAVSLNSTHSDRTATLTFSNGVNSKNVSITQKYKPYINTGPTSFPATGGTLNITAHTEYDVVFRSVPTWVTSITINNVVYTEGQRIAASAVDGQKVYFSAEANTGSTERTTHYGGMNMAWYVGDTLITQGVAEIDFVQPADTSGIDTDVDSLVFDYNTNVAQTVQVITNGTWDSTISDN